VSDLIEMRIWRRARRSGVVMATLVLAGGFALSQAMAASGSAAQVQARPIAAEAGSADETSFLGSVSCPGSSFCVAVGVPPAKRSQATGSFSQIWNGKAWQTIAVPSSQPGPVLSAVTCRSESSCLTVGFGSDGAPVSDAWNGKAWRSLPAPPGRPKITEMYGVSCPAASDCIAAGLTRKAQRVSRAAAEQWNGSSWTRLIVPVPAGATGSLFYGISCASTVGCLAVGAYSTETNGGFFPAGALAEWWDGHTWTLLTQPAGSVELTSVSCPGATSCVAVGWGTSDLTTFAAEWSGTSWTTLTTPSEGVLTGISCPSVTECIAVGSDSLHFAGQWTGGTGFTLMAMPSPGTTAVDPSGFLGGGDYGLDGVSCASATACLAVGGATGWASAVSYGAAFAARWNGTSWQASRPERSDDLLGVSCTEVWRCVLTGSYLSPSENVSGLAETWNGTTAKQVSPRNVPGNLAGVSCQGAGFCMSSDLDSGARWTGSRWITTPFGTGNFADRMSCPSPRFCMGVSSGGSAGTEMWNGSDWRGTPLQQPEGTTSFNGAFDVSCTSSTFCLAVGSYATDAEGDNNLTFIETWNGTRWKLDSIPAAVTNVALSAVSCANRTNCQVAGTAGAGQLAAAQWNGKTWRVRSMPGNGGEFANTPLSISCASASSCMAVGTFGDVSANFQVADVWNGHAWKATKSSAAIELLTAVSCPAAGHCLAVGVTSDHTRAEQWNGQNWKLVKTINQ
jgi:hypothetical protein